MGLTEATSLLGRQERSPEPREWSRPSDSTIRAPEIHDATVGADLAQKLQQAMNSGTVLVDPQELMKMLDVRRDEHERSHPSSPLRVHQHRPTRDHQCKQVTPREYLRLLAQALGRVALDRCLQCVVVGAMILNLVGLYICWCWVFTRTCRDAWAIAGVCSSGLSVEGA